MRHFSLFAAAFLLFSVVGPTHAEAANPGFNLTFHFKPSFNTGGPTAPSFFLDVCADPGCGALTSSIPMACNLESLGASQMVAVQTCHVHAVVRRRGADPAVALLSVPVTVRVRANNLVSAPFGFPGATPVFPEMAFRYQISQGPGGFAIAQQR